MAGSTRRVLTTDDLLRMQEDGPSRKRRREDFIMVEDSDSEMELPFKHAKNDTDEDDESEGEGEELSSGSGSGSGDDSNSEDDEVRDGLGHDSDQADEIFAHSLSTPYAEDDTSSSRISIVPRTSLPITRKPPAVPPNHPTSFATMGISATLLTALAKMSIRSPTEIQSACIPPLLQGEYSKPSLRRVC